MTSQNSPSSSNNIATAASAVQVKSVLKSTSSTADENNRLIHHDEPNLQQQQTDHKLEKLESKVNKTTKSCDQISRKSYTDLVNHVESSSSETFKKNFDTKPSTNNKTTRSNSLYEFGESWRERFKRFGSSRFKRKRDDYEKLGETTTVDTTRRRNTLIRLLLDYFILYFLKEKKN